MNYLKTLGVVAIAALAMTAFTAGSASATSLEVGGVSQNKTTTVTQLLKTGTSALLQITGGGFANTCTEQHWHWDTTTFLGFTISAKLTSYYFKKCTTEGVVVDKPGELSIERIGATTNGTVRSVGAEVTVPSPIGNLNCKTGAGVDIGTLTGVKEGHATMDVNAVTNCGFLAPSLTWTGTYTILSPTGLGVTA